jgi:hypothetical protein
MTISASEGKARQIRIRNNDRQNIRKALNQKIKDEFKAEERRKLRERVREKIIEELDRDRQKDCADAVAHYIQTQQGVQRATYLSLFSFMVFIVLFFLLLLQYFLTRPI